MKEQPVSQITRRLIEAELYGQMYETMTKVLGKQQALEIIEKNLHDAAVVAGKGFAASVPVPNLEHFSTVVELWKKGDAIEVENLSIDGNRLTIKVVRCSYQESYREMGLPDELCRILSCCRDEPFAKGYSDRLRMERSTTLAEGGSCCPFEFYWE